MSSLIPFFFQIKLQLPCFLVILTQNDSRIGFGIKGFLMTQDIRWKQRFQNLERAFLFLNKGAAGRKLLITFTNG